MDTLKLFLDKLSSYTYDPLVAFLKQEGLWHYAEKIYWVLYDPISNIIIWISTHIGIKTVIKYIIAFIYLVINIFVTLFHILVSIYGWIMINIIH